MNKKKLVRLINTLWFFLALLPALVVKAQNPLVTHRFTADPTARVFDGRLYVYPSTDIVPPEGIDAPRFCMPGYHIFSTENGASWKDHGQILDHNEVPWGKKNAYGMWAPDCIKRGDKYYYYYPAPPKDGSAFRRIGVGVSKSPGGPFKWEKNYIEGVQGIDPGLLLDGDSAYLYYGGGEELFVAPLKDNMKEIAAEPIKVNALPSGYKEGSFVFKRNELYYFTFAHVFPDEGYTIAYATSTNPMGPYTYRGKIMDNISNGTNHHSIVKYKDQWILFYHWWDISGFNKLRSMRADYIHFKEDGTIKKVKPTLRGIGTPGLGDTLQIDRYSSIHLAETTFVSGNEPDGWMVHNTQPGGFVRFDRVNFGEGTASKITARMACGQRVGTFEVRLDNPKGKVIATFEVTHTGGWNHWKTITTDITEPVTGIHDLVVVFHSEWGLNKIVNLNWLLIED
ncbi:family 43 glycosylhydrolase [Fulvivirga sp. M361]|uniref:family 43 glycosylhydrolase n=1 Tax=Fulvivirga sp. M361 TaxID=2594266 RepID=UPI00117B57CC|nr:family 43 glycosylhydrolase [Fulvivirga sp. M361]TRX57633.1 family 43 glycosylhydrolase [Fulvivirga sp. M361]